MHASLKSIRRAPSFVFGSIKRAFLIVYFFLIPGGKFTVNGIKFPYFRHSYNRTWENERIVEVPVAYKAVRDHADQRDVLEIGNVLKNYHPFLKHDVLDKYEKGPHIINEDAESFRPAKKYGLIVSASTIEHIGWDEEPRDPEKLLRAVGNIVDNCLADGGEFLMTLPIGYNTSLDAFIDDGRLKLAERSFLRRISEKNEWIQSEYNEVKGTKFGFPFQNANAIMFGVLRK